MSAEEKNKALVRCFVQAQDEGDLDALDELLAPDFVDHNPLPGQDLGREGYMHGVAEVGPRPLLSDRTLNPAIMALVVIGDAPEL